LFVIDKLNMFCVLFSNNRHSLERYPNYRSFICQKMAANTKSTFA